MAFILFSDNGIYSFPSKACCVSTSYSSFPTDNTATMTKPTGICLGCTAVVQYSCQAVSLACWVFKPEVVLEMISMFYSLLALVKQESRLTPLMGHCKEAIHSGRAAASCHHGKQKAELLFFLAAPCCPKPGTGGGAGHGTPGPPCPQLRLCGRLMTSHSFP